MAGSAARAQVLPGTVDPSQVQKRLLPQEQEQPVPQAPPQPGESVPAEAPEVQGGFTLTAIEVEGVTVFTQEELMQICEPYLGKAADLGRLQFIAGRMTQLYREHGYLLSRVLVPAQDIEGGRARLTAVEGYVSRVRLAGAAWDEMKPEDAAGIIDQSMAGITAMRPLHGPSLERQLLLLNDLAGIEVRAVLEPLAEAEAAPGAVGLVMEATKQENEASVTVDNLGSRYIGPFELTAQGEAAGVLTAFDRLSGSLLATGQVRELKAVAAEYTLPVNADGGAVTLRGGHSALHPGHTLLPLGVKSRSLNLGLQYTQNIVRTRRENLSAWGGLDIADITTDFSGVNLYRDKITALRLGVQFDGTDSHGGANAAAATLSQGLNILGARETGSASLSRATGHSDFTKATARLSRQQDLGASWQAYAAASGQYAWDPLLSSEEFGYGGQSFGRAYDFAEITGDHGIAGALEIRHTGLPDWRDTRFQPFGFYDIGKVWKPDAAPALRRQSGASAGMGLRFSHALDINGYFAVALPLTRPAAAPPGYSGPTGPRYLFVTSLRF